LVYRKNGTYFDLTYKLRLYVSFEKIDMLSTGNVGFYTIRLGSASLTEFEKFDDSDFTHHHKELEIIYLILKEMGLRGAEPYYFRPENGAEALPAKRVVPLEIIEANSDYGIRLYCIRLTKQVVILLNGGIKTNLNPKICPNVKMHFRNAYRLSAAITQAKLDGDIDWYGTVLEPLKTEIDLAI
jgi:hypothetical protein